MPCIRPANDERHIGIGFHFDLGRMCLAAAVSDEYMCCIPQSDILADWGHQWGLGPYIDWVDWPLAVSVACASAGALADFIALPALDAVIPRLSLPAAGSAVISSRKYCAGDISVPQCCDAPVLHRTQNHDCMTPQRAASFDKS